MGGKSPARAGKGIGRRTVTRIVSPSFLPLVISTSFVNCGKWRPCITANEFFDLEDFVSRGDSSPRATPNSCTSTSSVLPPAEKKISESVTDH